MIIYIPTHLTELKIIDQLSKMLRSYSENYYEEIDLNDYLLYDKLYDYVKEFVSMMNSNADDTTINYITNLFYLSKGTYSIFELMEKHLNIKFSSDPLYTIDSLVLDIESIDTINMVKFRSALENFIKSLLYLKGLSIIISIVNFYITSTIVNNSSFEVFKYKEYSFKFSERDK